jgi:hypothetical protein
MQRVQRFRYFTNRVSVANHTPPACPLVAAPTNQNTNASFFYIATPPRLNPQFVRFNPIYDLLCALPFNLCGEIF